jgi:hypothetical protein
MRMEGCEMRWAMEEEHLGYFKIFCEVGGWQKDLPPSNTTSVETVWRHTKDVCSRMSVVFPSTAQRKLKREAARGEKPCQLFESRRMTTKSKAFLITSHHTFVDCLLLLLLLLLKKKKKKKKKT